MKSINHGCCCTSSAAAAAADVTNTTAAVMMVAKVVEHIIDDINIIISIMIKTKKQRPSASRLSSPYFKVNELLDRHKAGDLPGY